VRRPKSFRLYCFLHGTLFLRSAAKQNGCGVGNYPLLTALNKESCSLISLKSAISSIHSLTLIAIAGSDSNRTIDILSEQDR